MTCTRPLRQFYASISLSREISHDLLKTVENITPVVTDDILQFSRAFKVVDQQQMVFKFIGSEVQICVLIMGDNNSSNYLKVVQDTLVKSGQGDIELMDNGIFHQVYSYKAYELDGGCTMDLILMREYLEAFNQSKLSHNTYTTELREGRLYVIFDGCGKVVISPNGTCVYSVYVDNIDEGYRKVEYFNASIQADSSYGRLYIESNEYRSKLGMVRIQY